MSLTPKILSAAVLIALAGSAAASNADIAKRGQGLLTANRASVHGSAFDGFVSRDAFAGPNGTEFARFDRTYRGLPVLGGDFVMIMKGGQLSDVSQTMRTELKLSTRPAVRSDEAMVAAGAFFNSDFVGMPKVSLIVDARSGTPALAYKVVFQGHDGSGFPVDMTYIVDAGNAGLRGSWSNIETGKPTSGGGGCSGTTSANGTGNTIYSGNVAISTRNCGTSFEMKDLTRGSGYTTNMANSTRGSGTIFTDADNNWGNNSQSDVASAAADAHFGIATTWDYFKNTHGRNGIANNGVGALSKVHYGRNYVNAFWSDSCFCMTFGDGDGTTYGPLVDLDVAGHEMSHGVTSRTANLTYSGESGGLNEATSDIFGTMVEFYANNAYDEPDYLIGEEIYISNPTGTKALRYMFNPELEGGTSRSRNCWYSGISSIDVHFSSGPANHFFYMLAEGSGANTISGIDHTSPTCNGSTIAGIGRAKAEKIWYLALTGYMTSSTNYAGARVATINAAKSLYGTSSAEAAAVAAAWSAVNVN